MLQEKQGCTSVFPSNPPSGPISTELLVRTFKNPIFPWQVHLNGCKFQLYSFSSCEFQLYALPLLCLHLYHCIPMLFMSTSKINTMVDSVFHGGWGVVVIVVEKLKMAEALLPSGRNYERGAGDFIISASRLGRGVLCSLAGEDTCHALNHHSGP